MEEFVEEIVENVKTFKDYKTYEIIPDNIENAIGQETILNNYSIMRKSRIKNYRKKQKPLKVNSEIFTIS
jgi:hypothetical protein